MSVATDTSNHENGSRGDSRIAPTGNWLGVIFRGMAQVRQPIDTVEREYLESLRVGGLNR